MATACLAALQPAGGQEAARARPNTITVGGSGEVKAAPDVAYVTLGVVNQAKRAQDAAQANAAATTKVIDAVRRQGIDDKDIQTSNYSVQPLYENRPNGVQTIQGYQVTNQVRVTVHKLTGVGPVIDAGLEAGANSSFGVSFGLQENAEHESRALVNAMRDARRKAEVLAAAGGLRISGVSEIHEGGVVRPVFGGGDIGFARAQMATPIQPGELTVSATIQVVFNVLPTGAQARAEAEARLHDKRIETLVMQRDNLAVERSGLLAIYTKESVQVRNIDRKIEAIEKELDAIRAAQDRKQ